MFGDILFVLFVLDLSCVCISAASIVVIAAVMRSSQISQHEEVLHE